MAKNIGGKAAKIALAAVGTAALSAVGKGVVQFCKWAKDPYSTELWFGFLKKGILITKTDEPNHFKVQTGYRWHNDAEEEEQAIAGEPEIEITLPEDVLDPLQDVPKAETLEETVKEAVADAVDKAIEKAESVTEEAAEAIEKTLDAAEGKSEA